MMRLFGRMPFRSYRLKRNNGNRCVAVAADENAADSL